MRGHKNNGYDTCCGAVTFIDMSRCCDKKACGKRACERYVQ